jgi:ATP-dependent DNA helicase RecG
VPVPKVTVKDLKHDSFEFFRKRAFKSQRIEEDILTDTNELLIENLQLKENEFLKRAAILLFHTYSTESEPPIPTQSEPLNFRF